ncbi:hypothetical protein Anas_07970 [Armadillidium nasatum]|uniref:Uncharacterized protein n=1 Tax=Armadillidium nasatum TaxID=96803 RepID=A0A5N5TJI8_9CRUS|nr:hypothetical protein Anas_07970 [Armadillidium nasatum]
MVLKVRSKHGNHAKHEDNGGRSFSKFLYFNICILPIVNDHNAVTRHPLPRRSTRPVHWQPLRIGTSSEKDGYETPNELRKNNKEIEKGKRVVECRIDRKTMVYFMVIHKDDLTKVILKIIWKGEAIFKDTKENVVRKQRLVSLLPNCGRWLVSIIFLVLYQHYFNTENRFLGYSGRVCLHSFSEFAQNLRTRRLKHMNIPASRITNK